MKISINTLQKVIGEIIHAAFNAALLSFSLFYVVEVFSPQFISRFYYLGDHLWVVIILGVCMSAFPFRSFVIQTQFLKTHHIIFLVLLTLIASAAALIKVNALGWIAFVVVPALSITILSICITIYKNGDTSE